MRYRHEHETAVQYYGNVIPTNYHFAKARSIMRTLSRKRQLSAMQMAQSMACDDLAAYYRLPLHAELRLTRENEDEIVNKYSRGLKYVDLSDMVSGNIFPNIEIFMKLGLVEIAQPGGGEIPRTYMLTSGSGLNDREQLPEIIGTHAYRLGLGWLATRDIQPTPFGINA